jgi:hypothetical protein
VSHRDELDAISKTTTHAHGLQATSTGNHNGCAIGAVVAPDPSGLCSQSARAPTHTHISLGAAVQLALGSFLGRRSATSELAGQVAAAQYEGWAVGKGQVERR